MNEKYRGVNVVIRFDGKKCIYSRHCVLDAPEVFLANVSGPWINPDAASSEKITRIAHTCPSGEISYEQVDGGAQEVTPLVNVVRVRENGPLAFSADLRIDGVSAGFRATLCRFGASKSKPLCYGSHMATKFSASGEPASGESDALVDRAGPLNVIPKTDGPLQVDGNLEICSGTGRAVRRCTQTWLCRCGGSNNKPFCDGTHSKIGFNSG